MQQETIPVAGTCANCGLAVRVTRNRGELYADGRSGQAAHAYECYGKTERIVVDGVGWIDRTLVYGGHYLGDDLQEPSVREVRVTRDGEGADEEFVIQTFIDDQLESVRREFTPEANAASRQRVLDEERRRLEEALAAGLTPVVLVKSDYQYNYAEDCGTFYLSDEQISAVKGVLAHLPEFKYDESFRLMTRDEIAELTFDDVDGYTDAFDLNVVRDSVGLEPLDEGGEEEE